MPQLTGHEIYTPIVASAAQFRSLLGSLQKTVDSGALAGMIETILGGLNLVGVLNSGGGMVGGALFFPLGALTANDANYATLLVQKRSAGGLAVTVASITTQTTGQVAGSGNWTPFVPVALQVAANAQLNALDCLTVSMLKNGAGVFVPAGVLCVYAG